MMYKCTICDIHNVGMRCTTSMQSPFCKDALSRITVFAFQPFFQRRRPVDFHRFVKPSFFKIGHSVREVPTKLTPELNCLIMSVCDVLHHSKVDYVKTL